MGLFDKLFGADAKNQSQGDQRLPWQELTEVGQLKVIAEQSKTKLQGIFKHSTRCGISKMVLKNFERNYDLTTTQIDLYYLDLLAHRDISTQIASQFEVVHESPQFIVIQDGKVIHHASHSDITPAVVHSLAS